MSSTATSRALVRKSPDRDPQTLTGEPSDSDALEQSVQESIKRMAYVLWEQRGCPEGSPEKDWREAEQQVRLSQEQTTVVGR